MNVFRWTFHFSQASPNPRFCGRRRFSVYIYICRSLLAVRFFVYPSRSGIFRVYGFLVVRALRTIIDEMKWKWHCYIVTVTWEWLENDGQSACAIHFTFHFAFFIKLLTNGHDPLILVRRWRQSDEKARENVKWLPHIGCSVILGMVVTKSLCFLVSIRPGLLLKLPSDWKDSSPTEAGRSMKNASLESRRAGTERSNRRGRPEVYIIITIRFA